MIKNCISWVFDLLAKILRTFGINLTRDVSLEAKILCGKIQMHTHDLVKEHFNLHESTSLIIFSKDRPPQLDLLLRSIQKFVSGFDSVVILYRASNEELDKAYCDLFKSFLEDSRIKIRQERNFREDLIDTLYSLNSKFVMFLVDDIVFRRPLDLHHLSKDYWPWTAVFSPRLGRNTVTCYTKNRDQKLPDFFEASNGALCWRWADGECDFSYPLSLDGHLFSTAEIRAMISLIEFKAPNSLEKRLQVFAPLFSERLGQCDKESILVNIPENRVQDEVLNRSESVDAGSRLMETWRTGKRINLENVVNVVPRGAHHPIPFIWE